MENTTAIFPRRFTLDTFERADPRFYAARDLVVAAPRRDNSSVAPDNAIFVPLTKKVTRVTLLAAIHESGIFRVEQTDKRPVVAGTI